ncbi:general secretion pathway protein GspC [Marinobacter daepoensis]|uniref:General secretion pathway protein GspC n=1 Tax=Marinobacter daepoensis TaxID=262077 RepID=A0ABS3BDB9_9GAMM|nr:type II secretion system protein N [Marinobacter daepoensis]MBN7769649.1 general secretion pathway protein GspC [Marinobacter daepoensis]MBY6078339.1 general secretion pathway protein GspC [Marinobacter daepoensis]
MARFPVHLQERTSRSLANILLIGLVFYVAVELARVTWLFTWADRPVPEIFGQVSGGKEFHRNLSGAPIAGYEFFGRPESQGGVADVVRRSAPETGLRLKLEGVLVGQRPEDSGAIVAGSNGETEYYRVGDQLPGNAELAEVEAGRILLRRGGRYESLAFEEEAEVGALVTEETSPSSESPDAYLENARERLDTQGVAALTPYGLQPAEGRGGYVYDGSNAMLNAVNLRPGDIITAVNGQSLGDIEQDKMLLDSWRSQPQLDIEVERDGTVMTVSYAIPQQWR